MAQLRRRGGRHEVLATRPGPRRQPAGSPHRLALALGRPRAGRRPAVQSAAADHAADGRGTALDEHQPGPGGRHRPGLGRDDVGLPGARGRRGAAPRGTDPRRRVLARSGARRRAGIRRERRAARGDRRPDRRPAPRVRRGGQDRSCRRRAPPGGVPLDGGAAHLPRHDHRRHLHQRPVRPAGPGTGLHPRLRRRHRTVEVALQHHPAAGRARTRDVGGRLVGAHRGEQRLDGGQRRRGAGLRLPADRHPDPQLVRGTPSGRQPVRGDAALPGLRDGTPRVALPAGPTTASGTTTPRRPRSSPTSPSTAARSRRSYR